MANKIKTLANLKRVAHHKVEETQKVLTNLMQQIHTCTNQIHTLQAKITQETKVAGADVFLLPLLESFTKKTQTAIKHIEKEKQTLEQQEAETRQQLMQHFAEEKRYDILHEKALSVRKKELEKKHQQQLDEVAATASLKGTKNSS